MIKRILFILIFMILCTNTSSEEIRVNITNMTYTYSYYPDNNYGNELYAYTLNYTNVYIAYIQIPEIPNNTLTLKIFDEGSSWSHTIYIYNTSYFDEQTLTWNTQPSLLDKIGEFSQGTEGYKSIILNDYSNYIALKPFDYESHYGTFGSDDESVSRIPYILYNQIQNINGYIYFRDIDNNTYPLPNALVKIDSIYYNYTDSNGYYEINYDTLPTTLYINKSSAYNTASKTITQLNNDFTLEFSKPDISSMKIESGYIKGTLSHNFKSVNLWEIPNFMWCEYYINKYKNTSNDKKYYKNAQYEGNNRFVCEKLLEYGDYSFRFKFSDMYNYNLSMYHSFLTGYRDFESEYMYIGNTSSDETFKTISKLSQIDRESTLKNYFWDYFGLWILIIFLLICFSYGSKK